MQLESLKMFCDVVETGSFAVHRGQDFVLLKLQIVRESAKDCRIVLDNKYLRHACPSNGSRTEKVLPRPTSLDTSILPLCASTTGSASARPSPVPSMLSVCAERTR